MRVLHVTSGNLYGGVETMLTTMARHSEAAPELEQQFAVCFEGNLSAELRGAGRTVQSVGEVRLRSPRSVFRARRRMRAVLESEAVDVAICHSAWSIAVFGPAVLASGVPLVFWLHDRAEAKHWLYRLARRTRPALTICNSRYTASGLSSVYPGVPFEVIYCPVEPQPAGDYNGARNVIRAELETPADAVVIVQVSRMESWKGHLLHLRALSLLQDLPEWRLWIVGGVQRTSEVAYLDEMERLATELGIGDRVRFLGQRSDVPRLLSAADIHCQPNTGPEPFGIVFVEALYAGLPCVATNLGGPAEILDEECGVLVPPADPAALASALRCLILDPERRARLGSAGSERARSLCAPAARMNELSAALTVLPGRAGGWRRGAR